MASARNRQSRANVRNRSSGFVLMLYAIATSHLGVRALAARRAARSNARRATDGNSRRLGVCTSPRFSAPTSRVRVFGTAGARADRGADVTGPRALSWSERASMGIPDGYLTVT